MSLKLTAESLLTGIKHSRLVESDTIDTLIDTLRGEGVDIGNTAALAAAMVEKGVITPWQSDKLLQGKFKGVVLGRYKLQNLLNKDETSSTYLAEHLRMKRLCTIKTLPASKVHDTSYLSRFDREVQLIASLDHPNIARVYDVDTETKDGVEIHFLVREYIDGQDMEKLLAARQQFTVVEAVDYIRQAAEGLSHAHANGLVHRDIKPGRLLVDARGVVKLLDLGLARFFRNTVAEPLTIKHAGNFLGTNDSLAPQQAIDSHAIDARADIYSLGCTFYFALTGRPPFPDGTLGQRLLAHQTKPSPPISKVRADVPESLAVIINKMMQKRKEDRYQSATEAATALSKWLVENGGTKWRQSHPALVSQFTSMHDSQPPRPEAVAIVDRRSVELQPTANAALGSRHIESERPGTLRPQIPAAVKKAAATAKSIVAQTLETVTPAEFIPATPAVEIAPVGDRGSHPMWIAAPPSAPLVAPPLPAVIRTSPNNRIDRRVIYLASLVIGAVLIVAGMGYTLVASSDEGKLPAIQSEVSETTTGSTIGP